MDPIVTAALIAMISGIVLFLFTLKGNKGQQLQAAGDSLRDDLLAQATRQDAKIERLEARVDRLENENGDLRRSNRDLEAKVEDLEDLREEHIARIEVLTLWGSSSLEAPPRTPPHWRP